MRIAVFGAGYVGLVTGACFADLGHDVVVRDIAQEKIDVLRAEAYRSTRRACQSCSSATASASGSRLRRRSARRSRGRLRRGRHAAKVSGDADLSAVWMVVDELPRVDRRMVLAMKSTVPVGTGRTVRHRLDERGPRERRVRVESRVHRRGDRDSRLHEPGPDRHRRVRRRRTPTSSRSCTRGSTPRSCARTSSPPR